jgi:hypothetical protein
VSRGLSGRQITALIIAVRHPDDPQAVASMLSLEGRGLAERYYARWNGRQIRRWRLTPAGRDLAGRLGKARNREEAQTP